MGAKERTLTMKKSNDKKHSHLTYNNRSIIYEFIN